MNLKKIILMLFIFLPLAFYGQQLTCCKSEKDVETYLSGNWKIKDSNLKRQYRYQFNNGVGLFQVFIIQEDGTLKEVKENQPVLKILKTEKGFEIEHNYGPLTTYTGIKYLDVNKLVITRRDGAERAYYKIQE